MTIPITSNPDRAATRIRRILIAAGATTLTAALAGLTLLALEPTEGSTTEAVLGFTAAVSGLTTGALVIAAAIYASVAGLWTRVPIRIRYVLWAALAASIAHNLWTQLQHLG